MEYVFVALAIFIGIGALWFVGMILRVAFKGTTTTTAPTVATGDLYDDEIQIVTVLAPAEAIDLRSGSGVTCAIAGTSFWTMPNEAKQFEGDQFYLRREPTNKHDPNAVAVYADKRKFGYLSAGQAARYAPVLDQIGSAFIVSRDLARPRISFIMPRIADLRKLAAKPVE